MFPLLALALLLVVPASAGAVDRVVTKTADTADGVCNVDCSLREALAGAALGDRIVVPAGTYQLTAAAGGELSLEIDATLQGAGASATIIRAAPGSRVLNIGQTPGQVTVSGVTITGGNQQDFGGGGIFAPGSPLLVTDSVITGNAAPGAGGGIYASSLDLRRSTVSGNSVTPGRLTFGGGGIYADTPGLGIVDSTISGNTASLGPGTGLGGGGIHYAGRLASITNTTISGNRVTFSGAPTNSGGGGYFGENGGDTFLNVTVNGNSSSGAPGGGLFNAFGVPFTLRSTIVSGNAAPSGSGCSLAARFSSLGNNIELPGNTCNLGAAGDKPNTNPALGPLAPNGGPTLTHALLLGSPAIDAGAGCPATDQRGVVRPQGPACDIGSFEWRTVDSPDTSISEAPTVVTRDRTPTFRFASNVAGATFECSIDNGPFVRCASPYTPGTTLGPGSHTFRVRARNAGGNVDPSPAATGFVIPAVLADLPPPVLGRTFNIEPKGDGPVLVSETPGASRARASATVPGIKGRNFVPLREARQVRVGSLIDTRRGTVRLLSARDPRGRTQSGEFIAGVFQVIQSRRSGARGLTELRLKGSSFRRCARAGHRKGRRSSAARHSKRRIRRVRGNARGRFRTRGRYSAATVRGTIWETTDRCDGTLTKVRRGRVTVRDLRRRKNISLRAGKSYLARARVRR